MSLWLRRRDKDGTVHHIAIPFAPLVLVAVLGMSLALIVPFLRSFRSAVVQSPAHALTVIVSILVVACAMIATAKISVIRSGQVVSYGPRLMSRRIRLLYVFGYVVLAIGAALALLFLSFAYSLH